MAESKKTKPTGDAKKPAEAAKKIDTIDASEEKPQKSTTAKAGKRSTKALNEVEAKTTKQKRLAAVKPEEKSAAKQQKNPTRPRTERAGKKYREAAKLIDHTKTYSLAEALELAVNTSPVKFDATVELHINLGVDPRQSDQNIRDTVVLPAGTGKNLRIAVLAEAADVEKAKKAGADIAGNDDLLAQLEKEQLNFDVLIATPTLMARLAKHAKTLGPRGLMPSPKNGTVSSDVTKAVAETRAGKVEYRVDGAGILHVCIGKVSFGSSKLLQNAEALLGSVRSARPSGFKGTYLMSLYVTTSMGPSIRVGL